MIVLPSFLVLKFTAQPHGRIIRTLFNIFIIQKDTDHYVVLCMLDKLIIENFLDTKRYLGASAAITTDPIFKRAVAKIQKPTGEY